MGYYTGKSTQGERAAFIHALTQAARAAGATRIRVTSGYRSPAHNAAVGGVSHSNHTTGNAMDGYALIGGRWVPLGVALKNVAGRYGLRSGDVPGFYNGGPDPVHVDDAANMGGGPRIGGGPQLNGHPGHHGFNSGGPQINTQALQLVLGVLQRNAAQRQQAVAPQMVASPVQRGLYG